VFTENLDDEDLAGDLEENMRLASKGRAVSRRGGGRR
jgi:hypothetical protein